MDCCGYFSAQEENICGTGAQWRQHREGVEQEEAALVILGWFSGGNWGEHAV